MATQSKKFTFKQELLLKANIARYENAIEVLIDKAKDTDEIKMASSRLTKNLDFVKAVKVILESFIKRSKKEGVHLPEMDLAAEDIREQILIKIVPGQLRYLVRSVLKGCTMMDSHLHHQYLKLPKD